MASTYRPYIPQTGSELIDLLRMMALSSPLFKDKTGYFPGRNIDTIFRALHEGLSATRSELGEARFAKLTQQALQARKLFDADPGDNNGGSKEGRELLLDMELLIRRR